MGKREPVRIVVLVEDQQLERFVRKTLEAYGLDRRRVDVRPDYPKQGGGSGKRYVENAYRKHIVAYRRHARENRALLLATEADEQSVVDRVRALDDQLGAIEQPTRRSQERIAYWVPKRQIETWGLWLTGSTYFGVKSVGDIEKEYCHDRGKDTDWRVAGEEFKKRQLQSKSGLDATELPSLNRAYQETERLQL